LHSATCQLEEKTTIAQLEQTLQKCEGQIQLMQKYIEKAHEQSERATNKELWDLRQQIYAYAHLACFHTHSFEVKANQTVYTLKLYDDNPSSQRNALRCKKELRAIATDTVTRDNLNQHPYVMGFTSLETGERIKISGAHPEVRGYIWSSTHGWQNPKS
jgi:hypothetical protein